jgi:hypothetical protein
MRLSRVSVSTIEDCISTISQSDAMIEHRDVLQKSAPQHHAKTEIAALKDA